MKKPIKPELTIKGICNLKEKIKDLAVDSWSIEGGDTPVIDILDLVDYLQELKTKHPDMVILSSKRSLYCGKLNKEKHKKEIEKYENDLKIWKEHRKQTLLKQIEKLDNE